MIALDYDRGSKNFFTDVIGRVSDIRFLGTEKVMVRDVLRVITWDLRMPKRPTQIVPVWDSLKSKLC